MKMMVLSTALAMAAFLTVGTAVASDTPACGAQGRQSSNTNSCATRSAGDQVMLQTSRGKQRLIAEIDTADQTVLQKSPSDENIARARSVEASSEESSSLGAAQAVDGDEGSRWSSEFSDAQWLSVDLGSPYEVTEVRIKWEAAYADTYVLKGSLDGTTWTTLQQQEGHKGWVSTKLPGGSVVRWIRMQGEKRATPYGYSIYELQVMGAAAAVTPTTTASAPPLPQPTPVPSIAPTLSPIVFESSPLVPSAGPAPPCTSAGVLRRRRNLEMCACRRRDGSADLPSGWSCQSNLVFEVGVAPPPAPPSPTVSADATCQASEVRRRRRDVDMCSCRRRSGSSDLSSGWTCKDNVVSPCVEGECPIGWNPTSETRGGNNWCQVGVPEAWWNLKRCHGSGSMRVKALTYNLFWWNLYGQRGGNGNSAGKLVQAATGDEKFDVIGFQECDSPDWIMGGAGLSKDDYDYVRYGANTLLWRTTRWEKISDGIELTCEDRADQYYGKRGVQWVRLRERTGQGTLFFMNHHGCLPVNSGGKCGGTASAHNTVMAIAKNAVEGDALLVVGDFNNDDRSSMIRVLEDKIHRIYGDWVDQVFSSCAGQDHVVETRNLGKGGSDHNAGMVIVNF